MPVYNFKMQLQATASVKDCSESIKTNDKCLKIIIISMSINRCCMALCSVAFYCSVTLSYSEQSIQYLCCLCWLHCNVYSDHVKRRKWKQPTREKRPVISNHCCELVVGLQCFGLMMWMHGVVLFCIIHIETLYKKENVYFHTLWELWGRVRFGKLRLLRNSAWCYHDTVGVR